MTGRFIAVVGPSGVGKDTVMAALATATPDLKLARRVITRPAALGGEDFESVTDAEFDARRAQGGFVLHWRAHGLRYGIPTAVQDDLASGADVLANLSRSILSTAQDHFRHFQVLLLTARRDVLQQRLLARNRETMAEIAQRLERADHALPAGLSYTEIDNSGPLQETLTAAIATLYPTKAHV